MKFKLVLLAPLLFLSPMTAFAQEAATDNLATSGTRGMLNLNGTWQVQPISGLSFKYPPPADGWKGETLPRQFSEVITSPTGPYITPIHEVLNPEKTDFRRKEGIAAWYRRDFRMPAVSMAGKRAVLHFRGMSFKSETWVNGTKLGTSVQGLLPLQYDITSVLRPGQSNRIEIGLAGREALFDLAAKTYTAPSGGAFAGIWGDVELEIVPEVSVTDTFVRTYVGAKRIEIDTTLVNKGKVAQNVQPQVSILDSKGVPQVTFEGTAVDVPPGQERTVTLKQNWVATYLWSPESPVLYNAQVALTSKGALLDTYGQRFGFREFEIRGRDFFLNGRRSVSLRNSLLTDMGAPQEVARTLVRKNAGQPYNTLRLHLGFNNEHILDAGDETGVMMHPELGWYHVDKFIVDKSDLWLANTLEYVRGFIRLHRNRPAVTIWNLTNETYWGTTDESRMKIAEQVLQAVRSLDPTRPQSGDGEAHWGGRLPIINIHYPDGAGLLRKQYPNSGFLQPNDLYWLKDKGINQSWPNNSFEWDRPLIIGEYWDPGAIRLEERTSFTGEDDYDFVKWDYQDRQGLDAQPSRYFEYLKRATDAYRIQGVAGLNPWGGDREQIMPPVAVRPLDFHPNFFGGRTGTRKVVVFNDSEAHYNGMTLQCRLVVHGDTVWEKNVESYVEPGKHRIIEIPIDIPGVKQSTSATLTVRLRQELGTRWNELSRHEETIFIVPTEQATAADMNGVVLLDTTGNTAKALNQLGATVTARKSLAPPDLAAATVLIVGEGTDSRPFSSLIGAFVRRGGRVLLISQEYGVPVLPELGQTDNTHVATRTWVRTHTHPIVQGVNEEQLSFWKPDNIVSTISVQKPVVGKSKAVLDAGGLYGLNWSPLLETPIGAGVVLQSQLNLVDRVEQEPLAGPMLLRILRYCREYKAPALQTLRLLADDNGPLKEVLAACSIPTSAGLAGQGPVLLDASYKPSADELQKLKSFVSGGGKVWLHGFTSANIASVASLFPFTPKLTTFDPAIQSAARRSDDALMSNISSQEFYWTRADFGSGGHFFNRAEQTARLGSEVLVLPNVEAGEKLIEPGLLVKVPSGNGVILFDTLAWEGALGAETEKVSRLVSSLALNLGADVQVQAAKNYSYSFADLTQQANMGYYDQVAGDGKGGWTDQGENDMRFFLINHVGTIGGVEGAMAVMEGEFPSVANLGGRQFRLLDPKKNEARSVITLRSQGHGPTLPAQALGIPFNNKAEKLWFLHTSCWAVSNSQHQEIGQYVIHYTDGTQSVFPLRYGLELSDWWNPKPLSNGKVAWTGKNGVHSPVGIYVSEWTNPNPTKTIKSIDLIGDKSEAQIVLLGITGGVESDTAAVQKTVAEWDFTKVANNAIPGVGAESLNFGDKPPTVVSQGESKGLRFQHGQFVRGTLKGVAGLNTGAPFSVKAVVTPEEKPGGYMGGIYEAMQYMNSGFRLTLNQQMLPHIEIFPGDGKGRYLQGKTPLVAGRSYRIEVKFDDKRAYLFLDDKLDASIDSPLPAAYSGDILVGIASGKDYHFNGVISRLSLSTTSQ